MAASYSSGISSSPSDLLQTLVTWLVAQAWTSDYSASEGSGWRAHLHKNGLYVNLRAAMNEQIWPDAARTGFWDAGAGYGIGVYLGDGYSGASDWDQQSGAPLRTDGSTSGVGMNLPAGSVAGYEFFDDGNDHITVVVERSPGIFCRIAWGPSTEFQGLVGLPEDFPYLDASTSAYRNTYSGALVTDLHGINLTAYPPMAPADLDELTTLFPPPQEVHTTAMVRVDAATFSGRWVVNTGRANVGTGYTGRFMRCALNPNPDTAGTLDEGEYPNYRFLLGRVHQAAYAGALILPIHCFALTDPEARWAPIGYPPTVFWCDAVGHGYAAGDIYQVGGLDYKLYPGFAVRKAA